MDVTYFRSRKPGPEILIENAVARQIPSLFPCAKHPKWTAGSLPIGAGIPDLVVVSFRPEVYALTQVEIPNEHILAYLRAVVCARAETISERVGQPKEIIIRCLDGLVKIDAVVKDSGTFALSPNWKKILPEIVTIEAKVTNWKKAVEQAARNSIFSHRSFIALPEFTAIRIKSEPLLKKLGVGLLSIKDDGDALIIRRPRHRTPLVWTYYYKLAAITAMHVGH